MSKKAKSTAATKKSGKKRAAKKSKKELNPAEVRKDISRMVESEAATMVQAAIDEGNKGQLAPLRYLLEIAKIFPAATDGNQATEDEDSLARTLLNRMGIPDVPIAREDEDEDDVPKAASGADGAVAAAEGGDAEKGSELGAVEEAV